MKISIVTPSYNRSTFLEETIKSIVYQKGDFELEYIIQDGDSDSEVLKILEKWNKIINSDKFLPNCNQIDFQYHVESDNGMYDALNKGFARSTGQIMAWLNTDDMYHPFALSTVSQIFDKFSDVNWITGIPNSYNHIGNSVGIDSFPEVYSQEFIRRGYYDVKFLRYGFNWIQQESTFWRRSLWEKAGGKLNDNLNNAADFQLWQNFADITDLVKVYSFLGGFRHHDDQFDTNPELYRNELPDISMPPWQLKLLKYLFMAFPLARKIISNRLGWLFLGLLGLELTWLKGRFIKWSHEKQKWILYHGWSV